jgi:hypothetical protein
MYSLHEKSNNCITIDFIRVKGRVIRFDYVKDTFLPSDLQSNKLEELKTLVDEHKVSPFLLLHVSNS